jgi:parallel beta-helix repeat protein
MCRSETVARSMIERMEGEMNRQQLKASVVTSLVAFVGLGAGTAWSADCGDRAGPQHSRVACACGDTVVTSTRLRSSDPVVQNVCLDDGLKIGADNITLDCRNKTLNGDDATNGVLLTGRRKVTIKNCRITAFEFGIRLGIDESSDSSRNTIIKNRLFDNVFDGIHLEGNSDHNLIGWNRTNDNGEDGIDLDDDSDWNTLKANSAWRNGVNGSGQGIEDCDECDHNTYIANTTDQTFLGLGDSGEGVGLWILGTDSKVIGNRGRRNARSGLIVEGTGAGVAENHFDKNGTSGEGDGICVVSGNVDRGGNRGRGNADAQVAFNQVSCPTVQPDGVEIPAAAVAARTRSADDDD